MRYARSTVGILGLMLMGGLALGEPSLQKAVRLDVPSQPLNKALNAFAEQSGLRIVFYTDAAEKVISHALSGSLTPEKALKILLSDSSLRYEFVDERTVAIVSVTAATSETGQGEKGRPGSNEQSLQVA